LKLLFTTLFLMSFIIGSSAFAQTRMLSRSGEQKSKKFGLTFQNYTGPIYKSFTEGSPAYGFELSIDDGGKHFRYFFKARANHSQGRQNFRKNNIIYLSKYEFMNAEPEIGVSFFPVARSDRGLNIYLWGAGNISYNYLHLMNIPTTVNGVDPKSQQFGAGYGGGVGFDLLFSGGSRTSGKQMLYAEIGFRESFVAQAGYERFEISGLAAVFGFGF
jgi:hypothetical protein